MASSLRVEPLLIQQLATNFSDLASAFDALNVAGVDLGDTGDPRLTDAIEQFIDQVHGGTKELASQFGQLQDVLAATAKGYEGAESHVVSEIQANLSAAGSDAKSGG